MKGVKEKLLKTIKGNLGFITILVLIVLLRIFVFSPIFVNGISMYPTLHDKDIMFLNKIDNNITRFEIVVIDSEFSGNDLIKRVVGLPGEEIEYIDNKLYINGNYIDEYFLNDDIITNSFGKVSIPEGHYFVLGDNRMRSKDSRAHGVVPKEYISGTTKVIVFPFNRISIVK